MHQVPVSCLSAGMRLSYPVTDHQGRQLVQADTPISLKDIRILKIWGIESVVILEDIEEAEEPIQEAGMPEIPASVHNLFRLNNTDIPFIRNLIREHISCYGAEGGIPVLATGTPPEPDPGLPEGPENPGELLRMVKSLGSPPAVYMQLLTVINRPSSSSDDIAGVILSDTALTARLLRLVNSSFYAFPGKIDTVTRAVTVAGTAQLCDLALASSIIRSFGSLPGGNTRLDAFWRHSLACAVIARILAIHRRESNVERLFVAGLLHDIGRYILFAHCTRLVVYALKSARASGKLLNEVESSLLPFNHGEAGRALLEIWNLPVCHQEAVGCHHDPVRARRYPVEAAIVHVADIIANAMRWGSSGEALVPPLNTAAWDLLGLDSGLVSRILEEARIQFDDARRILLEDAV